MDDPVERSLPGFLAENFGGFAIGVAGMHDERQLARPRGLGVGAEDYFLPRARAVLVVEVEAAFADPDHPGMLREPSQRRGVGRRLARCLMGVDADRAPDVIIALSKAAHRIEFTDLCADR